MTYYRPIKSSNNASGINGDAINSISENPIISSPSKTAFFKEKVDYDNIALSDNEIIENDVSVKSKTSNSALVYSKPVIIFGGWIDLTRFSPYLQYIILTLGLLLFMCLYGYYQELVAYTYFERKLTIFSTFLHFLGCFFVAHGQRQSTVKHGIVFTMGTAPHHISVFYYCLLIGLKTASQGLTNLSMTQINYPAKVLFKSANPMINMIIGLVWFRRSYMLRDYIVVGLLVVGLYVFVNGDARGSPSGTKYGITLVTIAMFCGAAVPMVQEYCINKYNANVEELLYHSFLGSSVISFFLSLFSGELFAGIQFIAERGTFSVWFSLIMFSVVGFAGSNFSTGLTLRFGSLINGITNTARKAVSLGLSFALFPSRNHLTQQHIYGALIFFGGLLFRSLSKDSPSMQSSTANNANTNVMDTNAKSMNGSNKLSSNGNGNGVTEYGYNINEMVMDQERLDDMDVEIGPILTANR